VIAAQVPLQRQLDVLFNLDKLAITDVLAAGKALDAAQGGRFQADHAGQRQSCPLMHSRCKRQA
jgi:hypothetical protein